MLFLVVSEVVVEVILPWPWFDHSQESQSSVNRFGQNSLSRESFGGEQSCAVWKKVSKRLEPVFDSIISVLSTRQYCSADKVKPHTQIVMMPLGRHMHFSVAQNPHHKT